MMKNHPIVKHIDGEWHTSEHVVLDHLCVIKMREHGGCKVHIWNKEKTKVLKTFRFNFSNVDFLLNKSKIWILNNGQRG